MNGLEEAVGDEERSMNGLEEAVGDKGAREWSRHLG